jgi:hypothetical protein
MPGSDPPRRRGEEEMPPSRRSPSETGPPPRDRCTLAREPNTAELRRRSPIDIGLACADFIIVELGAVEHTQSRNVDRTSPRWDLPFLA